MKTKERIVSVVLVTVLCSTGLVVPGYADEKGSADAISSEVSNLESTTEDSIAMTSEVNTAGEAAEIIGSEDSILAGLDTRGINPELSDNVVKSLLTDNFTAEDAKTLATMRDAVLLEGTFNNQYYYTSQRFNTSISAAVGAQINIYLVNTGSRNIRMYTTRDDGVTMESAVVRPGDAQLFTIDNYDILYYGTQMLPGYTALSYYVHADTTDGGPISFTLRIKHYDV